MLTLPLEIIELIIDALVLEDTHVSPTSSVEALSLVCRALRPPCRKRLFATISLSKPGKNDLETPRSLLKLLEATPELGPCVRTVKYVMRPECPRDPSTFHAISRQFTKLQSLHLLSNFYNNHKWNLASPYRYAFLSLLHLPTLTHLKIVSIGNFSLSDLIPCTGLKSLDIASVNFDNGSIQPSALANPPIRIDRLSMSGQCPKSLQCLQDARRSDGKPIIDLSTVKSLSVVLPPAHGLEFMKEFLRNMRHLVKFEVEPFSDKPYPLNGLYKGLVRSLATLEHLKLSIFVPRGSDSASLGGPITRLSHELEKLSGRNVLHTIEFVVTAHLSSGLDRLGADEWGSLDQALSKGGGWPALKFVSLLLLWHVETRHKQSGAALLKLPETCFAGLVSSPAIRFKMEIEKWHCFKPLCSTRVYSTHTLFDQ